MDHSHRRYLEYIDLSELMVSLDLAIFRNTFYASKHLLHAFITRILLTLKSNLWYYEIQYSPSC